MGPSSLHARVFELAVAVLVSIFLVTRVAQPTKRGAGAKRGGTSTEDTETSSRAATGVINKMEHGNFFGGKWYFDWMLAKRMSISGAKGAYVMTNGTFTEVYPVETNRNEMTKDSLQRFI